MTNNRNKKHIPLRQKKMDNPIENRRIDRETDSEESSDKNKKRNYDYFSMIDDDNLVSSENSSNPSSFNETRVNGKKIKTEPHVISNNNNNNNHNNQQDFEEEALRNLLEIANQSDDQEEHSFADDIAPKIKESSIKKHRHRSEKKNKTLAIDVSSGVRAAKIRQRASRKKALEKEMDEALDEEEVEKEKKRLHPEKQQQKAELTLGKDLELPNFNSLSGERLVANPEEKNRLKALIERQNKRIQLLNKKRESFMSNNGDNNSTAPFLGADDTSFNEADEEIDDLDNLDEKQIFGNNPGEECDCKLCYYCGVDPMFASEIQLTGENNALALIKRYDIRYSGQIPDSQLFVNMQRIFNKKQYDLFREKKINVYYVTVEEIRDHFLYHDITNVLRSQVRDMRLLDEIVRKGSKKIFQELANEETDENGELWNSRNHKMLLQTMSKRHQLTEKFAITRTKVLQKFKASFGNAETEGGEETRHMNNTKTHGEFIGKAVY